MAKAQSSTKKGLKNSIYSFLGVLTTMALGILIPRVVLVNYGSETNGLTNSINQVVAYLSLLEAGIATTAMQALYAPMALKDKDQINSVMASYNKSYRQIGTIYFVILLLLSAVYPFFIFRTTQSFSYIEVFLCVFFSGFGNVIIFFFHGKYRTLINADGKGYLLSNVQSITTVLISLSKIFLMSLGLNIVFIIVNTFAFNLIQAVYIWHLIRKDYRWVNLKVEPSKEALSKKNYVFIHQLAWMIFQNTDLVLITVFTDLKVASIYAIYKLVVNSLQGILNIPLDAFNFALGQEFNLSLKKYTKKIDCIELYYSTLIFSMFSVAYCLYDDFIFMYTSGVKDTVYQDAFLPLLFVVVELLIFARKPMSNTITFAGKFKETLAPTIIEAVINLVVSIVGCYYLGIYGVLIGTVVALTYRLIDIIVYTNKKVLRRRAKKTILIYVINFLLFSLVVMFDKIIPINARSIPRFLCFGVVLSVLFFATYFVVNSVAFKAERKLMVDVAKKVFRKLKKRKATEK